MTDAPFMTLDASTAPSLRAVAERTRSIIDATVRTVVDESALNEAAELLARADAILRAELRDGPRALQRDATELRDRGMVFSHNPVIGHANPIAPPVPLDAVAGGVRGRVVLGHAYEGPPGYVHGGMLALVLDQSLGYANVVAGLGGMTKSLHVTYLRPTPLDTELEIWSAHDVVDGRDIISRGTITVNGVVTVEAYGIFRALSRERGQRYFAEHLRSD